LCPYVFIFDNITDKGQQRFGTKGPQFDLAFVERFTPLLSTHKLNRFFSLYLLSEVEKNLVGGTQGYANVTFANTGNPDIVTSLIPTTWSYGLEKPEELTDGSKPPLTQWACWPGIYCIINGSDGHIKVARRELSLDAFHPLVT
jgi:hypothetical protein